MLFLSFAFCSVLAHSPADAEEPVQTTKTVETTEPDLPVDESIKVSITPLQVSSLVDRMMEPVTIKVRCPEAARAQLFFVAVDAPYGGKVIDKPRLIGSDLKPEDGLTVRWSDKLTAQYIKVYAVVRKKGASSDVRSKTIDLAVGGARLDRP